MGGVILPLVMGSLALALFPISAPRTLCVERQGEIGRGSRAREGA